MITVIFSLDLITYTCSFDGSKALSAIHKSIENVGALEANIQMGTKSFAVLQLPTHEQEFSQLVYWCKYGEIPYKTLWLNDVAEWHTGERQ